ncbi:Phthiocerol synthesis polyketide synthase type I PpsC, partial [Tetrabaena socialis]
MDASADGYGRGEACRALWLRAAAPAAHATPSASVSAPADAALAVVVATAVNTNGKASGLTAPHGPTQQQLLLAALRSGGVRPADVCGLQLHANGTPLGDPIEAGSAAAAYLSGEGGGGGGRAGQAFAWLSVKGYGGHQEAGAGVSQLQETIISLAHLCLPPAYNLRSLNPLLEAPLAAFGAGGGGAEGGPGSLVARGGRMGLPLAPARSEGPAIFGVSSFGAQGTNAHALLAAPPSAAAAAAATAAAWPAGLGGTTGAVASAACWQPGRRHWVAPEPQLLLHSARVVRSRRGPGGVQATLLGRLDHPSLDYLWDGPRAAAAAASPPLLSNAAVLAAAAAAVRLLLSPDTASASAFVLHDVVLSLPPPLPDRIGVAGHSPAPDLRVTLSREGVLRVHVGEVEQLMARACAAVEAAAGSAGGGGGGGAAAAPAAAAAGPGDPAAPALGAEGAVAGAEAGADVPAATEDAEHGSLALDLAALMRALLGGRSAPSAAAFSGAHAASLLLAQGTCLPASDGQALEPRAVESALQLAAAATAGPAAAAAPAVGPLYLASVRAVHVGAAEDHGGDGGAVPDDGAWLALDAAAGAGSDPDGGAAPLPLHIRGAGILAAAAPGTAAACCLRLTGAVLVSLDAAAPAVARAVAAAAGGGAARCGLTRLHGASGTRSTKVRTLQPDATECTEADALELMEMILGALGNDAIGLGSSITHPRESEEWLGMSLAQKYEFFAPIWRVMRDDAMPVEEVQRQVEHVALSVKQGSQISDMRHHRFAGRLLGARAIYFRAGTPGACDYVNDS